MISSNKTSAVKQSPTSFLQKFVSITAYFWQARFYH